MHLLLKYPQFVTVGLACLCLVVLQLIRGRTSGSRPSQIARLVAAISFGFILTVLTFDGAMSFFGAQRIHAASLLVTNAVKRVDPRREQIVMAGSSQTSQGINDELLEKLLNQSGLDVQVIQLAAAAIFDAEGDLLIEEYLARTPRQPAAIFIDMGFDAEGLPIIGRRRGALEVAAAGWTNTWQRMKISWLRNWQVIKESGVDRPALGLVHAIELLSDASDAVNFFLCNVSNCGLLRQLDPAAPGQYSVGTDLHYGHANNFTADMMLGPAGMACDQTKNQMLPEFIEPSSSFRTWQKNKYAERGVPIVGFYYPPNQSLRTSCFERQLCGRLSEKSCLTLNDNSILSDLNSYEYWYDAHHVNNIGVPIFTAAMARDIEKIFVARQGSPTTHH